MAPADSECEAGQSGLYHTSEWGIFIKLTRVGEILIIRIAIAGCRVILGNPAGHISGGPIEARDKIRPKAEQRVVEFYSFGLHSRAANVVVISFRNLALHTAQGLRLPGFAGAVEICDAGPGILENDDIVELNLSAGRAGMQLQLTRDRCRQGGIKNLFAISAKEHGFIASQKQPVFRQRRRGLVGDECAAIFQLPGACPTHQNIADFNAEVIRVGKLLHSGAHTVIGSRGARQDGVIVLILAGAFQLPVGSDGPVAVGEIPVVSVCKSYIMTVYSIGFRISVSYL